MKIIHCADLHLDSKMQALSSEKSKLRRNEILNTFCNMVDYAIENNVKVILIAGDMFDTEKVTKPTKEKVIKVIENATDIDFLYLSGNHDEENFFYSLNMPKNFFTIKKEWTYFNYYNVCIGGVILDSVNCKTIYDTLSFSKDRVNIALLHGVVAGYKNGEESIKTEIISIPKLKEKNIDYLALGHYHTFVEGKIDTRGEYAYSGCLEGRGFDELGKKGFVLLDIEGNKITHEFIPFSKRCLYEENVDISSFDTFYSACKFVKEQLTDKYSIDSLLKINLIGEHKVDFAIDTEILSNELNNIFFFAKVNDKTTLKISLEDYKDNKTIVGEFVRGVLESDLTEEEKNRVLMCGLNALKGENV